MTFAWILVIIVAGQKPVSFAGFHTKEACELIREGLNDKQGMAAFCLKGGQA